MENRMAELIKGSEKKETTLNYENSKLASELEQLAGRLKNIENGGDMATLRSEIES